MNTAQISMSNLAYAIRVVLKNLGDEINDFKINYGDSGQKSCDYMVRSLKPPVITGDDS